MLLCRGRKVGKVLSLGVGVVVVVRLCLFVFLSKGTGMSCFVYQRLLRGIQRRISRNDEGGMHGH